jgi:hypothetical protein
MTSRLVGYIFLIIISIASLHNIHAQKDPNPGINTMYIPVGKLHPRSDFAGILINLNVAAAIKRGKMALEMTNTFLQNHIARQTVKEYSGNDRVIHFIQLKRDKVQHNLDILEADLYAARKQFKIQNYQETVSNNIQEKSNKQIQQSNDTLKSLSRVKRKMDFDIKVDVNACLTTIVGGIVSIFSSPSSLDKIRKSVKNLAFRTSRLESNFDNYTEKVDLILKTMQNTLSYYVSATHMIPSINSALDFADDTIMELLHSITPLVQGHLTHNLLDPLQAQEIIDKTQQKADQLNLQVIIDQPSDILKCSVTTFATAKTWYALISLPLIHRAETMTAYRIMNIPWFYQNKSVQWDLTPGIIATDEELYPNIKNVFIPQEHLGDLCDRFNDNYLCHKRINHIPTCHIALMNNHTDSCALKLADHKVRYSFGHLNYLFFQFPTTTMVKCPNKKPFPNIYHGLVNMNNIENCKISTKTFTLLPKTSLDTPLVSTINATKVTVLDNEWLKVVLQFHKNQQQPRDDDQDPWSQVRIIPNNEDVKLFGSYTILIHSIGIFFIVTILLLLLTICIMNFLDYIPEQLRTVYPSDKITDSIDNALQDNVSMASSGN